MEKLKNKREEAADGFEEWGGYMAAKKAKLIKQYGASESVQKESDIFDGIAIFVNGYTNPSADDIKLLMLAHGGVYHQYQMPNTTHIVASNLPNVKINNKSASKPIVKADWISDSVTEGRLLDYRKYLLYTNQNSKQPVLDFPAKSRTLTAADPNFLTEFYSNSRLHLISTLGAEYKQLVRDLRMKSDGTFPGREKLRALKGDGDGFTGETPVVMHIDMDCFFVSVGVRKTPELRGRPLAVTHARSSDVAESSTSEIASCSYEARDRGVRNGMFLGTALKLCPDLQTISYDFQGYREVSTVLYETIAAYTLDIEAVSCDEMYVDVGAMLKRADVSVDRWASHIRDEILAKTGGCPCSTGFGANRLQARLATKRAKPAGQFYLRPHQVQAYMTELPVSELPGVGRATLAKLRALGVETCGDLQTMKLCTLLQAEVGRKTGEALLAQARGIDRKPLNFQHERKSVSADVNYGIRFKDETEALRFLNDLSTEVHGRLCETGMRARCLTLKLLVRAPEAPQETAKFLGCGVCTAINRSTTSGNVITDAATVYREAKGLYLRAQVPPHELRGVGIQLTRLEKAPVPSSSNSGLNRFLRSNIDHQQTKSDKQNPITANDLKKKRFSFESEKVTVTQNEPEKSEFNKLDWTELKRAMVAWFDSDDEPSPIDVDMIGRYLKELAIDRKLEDLRRLTSFMYRHVSNKKSACAWHGAYLSAVNAMQTGMIARYGSTLLVERNFPCCTLNK